MSVIHSRDAWGSVPCLGSSRSCNVVSPSALSLLLSAPAFASICLLFCFGLLAVCCWPLLRWLPVRTSLREGVSSAVRVSACTICTYTIAASIPNGMVGPALGVNHELMPFLHNNKI